MRAETRGKQHSPSVFPTTDTPITNIKDRTMLRGNRHHGPPKRWAKRRNEMISALRSPVESVFGTCKRSYGMGRARYTGRARVSAQVHLTMTVYNLARMLKLPPGASPA